MLGPGFIVDTWDEVGVIQIGPSVRTFMGATVIVCAFGVTASILIVRLGAPGWQMLAVLFIGWAGLFVYNYVSAPERMHPPVKAQVSIAVVLATLCWGVSRRTDAGREVS